MAEPTNFFPLPIPGLVAWYDFSDYQSLWQDTGRTSAITADGQIIKGVTDKSGNGKHLSEATNGPTYKVAIQNGRSVARFDGTNDTIANAGFAGDTSYTVFLVVKKQTAPGGVSKAALRLAGGAFLFTNSANHATQYVWFSNEAAGAQLVGGNANNWEILVLRINSAASMDVYAHGGTPVNFDPADAVTTGTLMTLGDDGGDFGDYDIGACVRWDSALASTSLNAVGAYLGETWNISWTAVS